MTFPRPVEGEVTVKLGTAFALGVKGSYLPQFSVPGIGDLVEDRVLEPGRVGG